MSEFERVIDLPSVESPKCVKGRYCDIDNDISPDIKCDPNYKYSRIDGKCNNLIHTNWGSRVNCQRRLLPPDYADGVSQLRVAADGSPLPNPRFMSTSVLYDEAVKDLKLTSLHMIWGQFIAHDTYKTPQYFGLALRCCPTSGQSFVHRECAAITDIPREQLSIAFNQTCMSFARSIGCHACSIGTYR